MRDLTFSIIIPARLSATRLPNKPLLDICGKTMIQRVWERARECQWVDRVIVATPDQQIYDTVICFGGEAAMTSPTAATGTDRIAEAAATLESAAIINVQGDEPLLQVEAIEKVAAAIAGHGVFMASAMRSISREEAQTTNVAKVVTDSLQRAMYFSRSPIPSGYAQDGPYWGHLGLYAYRREFLLRYPNLPRGPLELSENLEQLRALENGFVIQMAEVESKPLGVDTPEDLEKIRQMVAELSVA